MSYKARFVFLVIWLSLCLFLFHMIYGKAKEGTIEELNARQIIHARQAKKGIETYIDNWLSILKAASEKEHVIALDDFGKDWLAFILNTHKDDIRAVTRVDENGKIIHTVPYDSKSIGADISYQKHVQAIIRTKRPVMSDVFSAVQGYEAIALHVPVFKDQALRGTLAVLLDFQKIARQFLEVIQIGKTGYAWMISAQGIEIYCPVPGHVGKSVVENRRDFPTIFGMAQEMLKGNSGVTTYYFDQIRDKPTGTFKKHAVYIPINIVDTFWSLVVASGEKEALTSLDGFRNWLVLVIGVLFIGAILFAYFAMRACGIVKEEKKRKEAEEMLLESNNRYRTLFDEAPVMDVTTYNQEGTPIITNCNKLFLSTLGYTRDEVLKQPLINFYTPESNRKMKESDSYKRAMDGGFLNEERQLVKRDGRIIETLLCALPEKNSDGQVCGTRAIYMDITQRKQAETALTAVNIISQTVNQSLNLDQILNDTLNKVMELLKPHSTHIRLFDKQTQELVLAAQKGLRPEDLEKLEKRLKLEEAISRHAIKSQKAVVIEDILTDPRTAGTQSFCEKIGCRTLVTIPLYGKDKMLGHMTIRSREPSAFTADEIQLFTSIGHQVGTAIENANLFARDKQHTEALSVLNIISQTVSQTLDLDIILNSAIEKVIELLKVDCGFLRLISENKQELVLAAHKGFTVEQISKLPLSRKYGDGGSWKALLADRVEHITFNPNDSFQQKTNSFGLRIGAHNAILFPLKSKNNMLGTMSIYSLAPRVFTKQETELTAIIGNQVGIAIENAKLYKEKEITIKELGETQKKLQQAQKMQAIGTLAGGIAHDFNNILSAIIGYTELALMKSKGNLIEKDLQEVLIASGRATDLVKQILTFSRRGGMEENKPIQVNLIVKEALKLLRSSLPTTIEIHENIQSDSLMLADPTQIHQVLMNLCTNAAHAMREKGGTLEVGLADVSLDLEFTSKHPEIEPGLFIRLTISDTGHGMPSDVENQIFDPFFTTKANGEGTGMGLAVVYGIVKSHGGAITVDSEPEKGATFHVFLPIIERTVVEERRPEGSISIGTEHILLVDDELPLVSIGKNILESLGYQVESRTSSIEALELFKAMPEKFDLVVTDMTMPNLRGDQLAKQLMEIRPGIPVILCTGFSSMIDEKKALKKGIRAFVFKPFLKHDMAKTIRKVLDEAKS